MTSSLRFLRAFSALFAVLAIVPATSQSIKFAPAVPYDSGLDPTSVAVADLNGDGTPDLVVANYCQNANCNAGAVEVLLGNGDGTFQSAVTYSTGGYYANSVAVGDVNGDGVPDLVVADWCGTVDQYGCLYQSGAVSVLLGNGDGTFQPAVIYNSGGLDAFSVAISDLKGDGRLDLVVSNTYYGGGDYNGSVGVLLGNGDGTFQPAVSYDTGGFLAASVAIGHLNGNGIPDLVVANFCADNDCYPANGEVGVLLGNGDGTFQPVVLYDSGGEGAYSVALGDMRGNGILDVVVTNRVLGGSVDVLLGNGNGTFQPAVGYTAKGWEADTYPAIGWGIDSLAIADVNGDGIPDVVAVGLCQRYEQGCIGTGQVKVLLGNGDGTFQKPIAYSSGGYGGSAIAIADVNGDGRPDLVVANACGNRLQRHRRLGRGAAERDFLRLEDRAHLIPQPIAGQSDGDLHGHDHSDSAQRRSSNLLQRQDRARHRSDHQRSSNPGHLVLRSQDLYDQVHLSRRRLPQTQHRNGEASGESLIL